jgi:hypothetical protein
MDVLDQIGIGLTRPAGAFLVTHAGEQHRGETPWVLHDLFVELRVGLDVQPDQSWRSS